MTERKPPGASFENWIERQIRKATERGEFDNLPDTARRLPSERAVRDAVAKLDERIADWLRRPTEPFVRIEPVDPETTVAQWRAARRAQD